MRPKRVLKTQTVKKKKRRTFSAIWKCVCLLGSCFLKLSVLVGALVMISLFFVTLYGWLVSSPYIRLEKILVTGVDREIKQELLDMSGLNDEVSLLAVNLNEVKEKLERHPWIRSIDVGKRFPHTLVIRAEKERPLALVSMDGLYYMNRSGRIFMKADQSGELDYPIVTGITEKGKAEQLNWALHVLQILGKEEGALSVDELSEVHVKKDGHVALYFSNLPAVIKLRGMDLEKRIGDMKRLVEHLNSTGRVRMVKGINLNYKDGAVVSLKSG